MDVSGWIDSVWCILSASAGLIENDRRHFPDATVGAS